MMVAALAVTGFVSCSDDDDNSLPTSGPVAIVLEAEKTTVALNGTVTITANFSGVKFTSSDTSVATVESTDGKTATVTAKDVGLVTITATKGNDNDGTYEYSYTPDSVTINVYPADRLGKYTGSMTVMGTESAVSLTIAEGSFTLNSGHPATYTKILWLKDADGNSVVAAQSDSTNEKNGDLNVENYTTASSNYIVFGTDAITYYVPAMEKMGGTCTLTKLTTADKAYWYGTYTGNWNILGSDWPMTAIAGESTFYYSSSMMSGSYEYVSWLQDDSGNWVLCGAHNAAPAAISEAACTLTFDASTGKGSFAVTAMSGFGAAELTKSSDSTEVPATTE